MVESCACARATSSSVPRPASRRSCVRSRVLALYVGVALRHLVTSLQTPQLEVVAGDLARHRDEAIVERGQCTVDGGATRFVAAAHATEDVDFPAGVEPRLVVVKAPLVRGNSRLVGRAHARFRLQPRLR